MIKPKINFYWSLDHVKTSQTGISTPFEFEIKENYLDILNKNDIDTNKFEELNSKIEKISEKYQDEADDIIDMTKNIIYAKLLEFKKEVDETIKKHEE